MINYQSPYGQIIRINSSDYYEMDDDEIKAMEEKYANSTRSVITFSKNFEADDDDLLASDPYNNLMLDVTDYDLDD